MLELADALEALTGARGLQEHHVITGASVDSRKVIPGSIFVARPGKNVDGHDYVGDAFNR
ncbi:MAG: UDP-N-acetylmuramoyl-tripeptide--D-alanyl-D-alanine ligase, partial [Gammaproteobacteria bacterium]|nr:UDP-N-acetylmuramoyl-tripeptide--D-alanyl-D-alanine ligase [Gammaproteobacteria bacterium]